MKKIDKLLKDYDCIKEQFPDMCLVKKQETRDSEFLPSHYVFTYYTYNSVSLVHMTANLNEDNKTYRVSSSGQVLLSSVLPEDIKAKLEKMKIQVGMTGAVNSDYKITSFER